MRKQAKSKETKAKAPLKVACGIGVFAAPLIFAVLIYISVSTGSLPFKENKRGLSDGWNLTLQDFDDLFSRYQENPALLNPLTFKTMLDKAEESSVGAQSRLSILKRRRALAGFDADGNSRWPGGVFMDSYLTSAQKAAKEFPHSAPVCAIAAEALLLHPDAMKDASMPHGTGALTGEGKAEIERLSRVLLESGPLSQGIYLPLVFSYYTLSGLVSSLEDAVKNSRAGILFEAAAHNTRALHSSEEKIKTAREGLLVDAALIHILTGSTGAAASFTAPLDEEYVSQEKTTAFLANYYYDYGNYIRSSALFSAMRGSENLELAADALYLAGLTANALNFWTILSAPGGKNADTRLRSIYNSVSLSAESAAQNEKNAHSQYISALEDILFIADNDAAENISDKEINSNAFVLYTRLLPRERALSVLNADERTKSQPLAGLELLKRNMPANDVRKTAAETWLLLNRHPSALNIYQWSAWFFEYQKLYGESSFLTHFAEQNAVYTPVILVNESIQAIRKEDFTLAEELLTRLKEETSAVPAVLSRVRDGPQSVRWTASANLGVLQEARRAAKAARESYAEALRLLDFGGYDTQGARKKAARLWMRIAHCNGILGSRSEVRPALEKALELDPDNINIRVSLNRLEAGRDGKTAR